VPTPLEQYSNLIEQAKELERMAGDGNYGGATYWGNRLESTRLSVAHAEWRRKPDDRFTWALPPESCDAIHSAFDDQKKVDALWLAAASILRRRAQDMRNELKKQADAVLGVLTELDEHGSK